LVRGHPSDDGGMLVVSDEELEAIAPEMSRDIDLRRFVPRAQIPPVYFDRPYYLAPAGRSTKAYHLLAETMEATGRAGVGTFVMRGHEYLVAILAEGGILRAETLRFAPELRTPEEVGLPKLAKAPRKQAGELRKAIDKLERKQLDMGELADDRADRLQALVERKLKRGEGVIEPSAGYDEDDAPEGEVLDLMAVLKERIGGKPRAGRRGGAGDDLDALSKSELYERAKALDIEGRSAMSKPQLLRAIRRAS
jgi:DNA end-binding protein Ku